MDTYFAKGYEIVHTGHSLGAAMAALSAEDYHLYSARLSRVVTIWLPKVGTSDFAAAFASTAKSASNFVNVANMPQQYLFEKIL